MPSVFASQCTPTVSVLNLHGMSAKGKGAKSKGQTPDPVEGKYKCRLMSNIEATNQAMLFLKQGGTNSFRCEMEKRVIKLSRRVWSIWGVSELEVKKPTLLTAVHSTLPAPSSQHSRSGLRDAQHVCCSTTSAQTWYLSVFCVPLDLPSPWLWQISAIPLLLFLVLKLAMDGADRNNNITITEYSSS